MTKESLKFFRKEAVDFSKIRLNGSLVLINEPRYKLLFFALCAFILSAITFICTVSFNKHERVSGVVSNSKSILKVYPPKPALLTNLFVKEGQQVNKGDVIATFRPNLTQLVGESSIELEKGEILKQLDNKHSILEVIKINFKSRKAQLKIEQKVVDSGLESLNHKLIIQEKQMALNEKIHGKLLELLKNKSITETDVSNAEQNYLTSKIIYYDLRAKISDLESTSKKNKNLMDSLPNEMLHETLLVENDIHNLQRQLYDINNNIKFNIYASHDGIISNILYKEGEFVESLYPVITILPLESEFFLELYIPSRAIGFVKVGMPVRARFSAFPVQIYGDAKASIVEMSNNLLFPSEWSNPNQISYPVYRVRAKFENQYLISYEDKLSFKSGLSVEADIILEERTIAEVFFDPIIRTIKTL